MTEATPLDPEVVKRIATLTLQARRAVEGALAGVHRSPHRGASVVFVEHREYRPGDDLRLLDWRAYARNDRHSIKHFEQEAQLRATLVLDRSGSMHYGEGRTQKLAHAATLLAALAYVLVRQGDAAGMAAIDTDVRDTLPTRSRLAHLDAIVAALAKPGEAGTGTDLARALDAVAERAGRRGLVVLASDLLDLADGSLAPLSHLVTRGHDVIVLQVLHPDELTLPFAGPTRFLGLEGEGPVEADADDVRSAYVREVGDFVDACRARCTSVGARHVVSRTDEPPERTLAALLRASRRRGWG